MQDVIPKTIEAAKEQARLGMRSTEMDAWLFLTAHANFQQLLKMQEHLDNLIEIRQDKP